MKCLSACQYMYMRLFVCMDGWMDGCVDVCVYVCMKAHRSLGAYL